MEKYILRLDDACPTMNKKAWENIENILDKYHITPIVGVIPNNKDKLFNWEFDENFWTETVERWKSKNWTIAIHGYEHLYHNCVTCIHSEFSELSYDEQKDKIEKGLAILKDYNVYPTCFFAPGHTFDNTTVDVIRDIGSIDFISDGYALKPYKYRDMVFFPSIFDTPHKTLPFGIFTFILHPNFEPEERIKMLEEFLCENHDKFVNADELYESVDKNRRRTIFELIIEPTIETLRKIRNSIAKR